MVKVLVLGWDGATWDIATKLMDEGKMPNLKKLVEKGTWGTLESSIPPWTVPAWNIMSTGLNPGKLGFATFFVRQGYKFKPYFLFKQFQIKRNIWDILSKEGKKVIVANLPNLHIAYGINGHMICGWLFLGENSLTYPPDLREELDRVCGGYEVDIVVPGFRTGTKNDKAPTSDNDYLLKSREILEKHFRAFEYLLKYKEWDFAFLVFAEPDRVQHRFWENSKIVEGTYQILDQKLGYIINNVIDNDTIVFLVSDHGFGSNKRILNINEFLTKEGYLKLKSSEDSTRKLNLFMIIRKLKLSPIAKRVLNLLPDKIREKILENLRLKSISEVEIDWENTKCYGYGVFGDIYLNVKGRDPQGSVNPEEYETIRDEIIKKLKSLKDPKTGKKLNIQVFKREDIYGVSVQNEKLPDLVILVNEDINGINPKIGMGEVISYGRGGNHRLHGIFLAYGPGIKKGQRVDAKIYDIAPTILHTFGLPFGLPIPNDMDGRVLMEIFEENSEFAKRKPEYVDPSYYEKKGEDEQLKKAIKNLKLKGKI